MEFILNSPLDMHIHFREGVMMNLVAPLSAHTFAGGVIMPNLVPPVDNFERLEIYTSEVNEICLPQNFKALMTLFFRNYNKEELTIAKDKIFAIKLYPAGATTNSEGGVKEISKAEETISIMQELGIPLLVHGETHGFVMDRESEFMAVYEHLAKTFPKLRIVMEHITTKSACDFLDKYENVFATVTLQHLLITLDNVAGGMLNPHLFCKPIAKRPEDRDALLSLALEAHPKLMFGSDSAPHPIHKKECSGCAAGVFTAPIALQVLTELFEQNNRLENLQKFVSDNAIRIHNLDVPHKKVTLEHKAFNVPQSYGDVVPMYAGESIAWKIKSVE